MGSDDRGGVLVAAVQSVQYFRGPHVAPGTMQRRGLDLRRCGPRQKPSGPACCPGCSSAGFPGGTQTRLQRSPKRGPAGAIKKSPRRLLAARGPERRIEAITARLTCGHPGRFSACAGCQLIKMRILLHSGSCHSGTVSKALHYATKARAAPELVYRVMPDEVALRVYQNNKSPSSSAAIWRGAHQREGVGAADLRLPGQPAVPGRHVQRLVHRQAKDESGTAASFSGSYRRFTLRSARGCRRPVAEAVAGGHEQRAVRCAEAVHEQRAQKGRRQGWRANAAASGHGEEYRASILAPLRFCALHARAAPK